MINASQDFLVNKPIETSDALINAGLKLRQFKVITKRCLHPFGNSRFKVTILKCVAKIAVGTVIVGLKGFVAFTLTTWTN